MANFTFGVMLNNANTTITQAMTASSPSNGGTLSVDDGSVFSTKGYAIIGSELIHYDSVSRNVLTLNAVDGRGSGGTTAAIHASSTVIYADIRVATHINELVAGSPNRVLTTKGDLLVASASNTPSRLGVGTTGQVVFADSTTATGLKYAAAPSAPHQVLIANTLVSSPVPSVDFQNIPATYKHLVLVISAQMTTIGDNQHSLNARINNDSTAASYDTLDAEIFSPDTLYTQQFLANTYGVILASAGAFGANEPLAFLNCTAYFPDYASTSKHKSVFSIQSQEYTTAATMRFWGINTGMWKSDAAINRITLADFATSMNFAANSRFTLYGLL